MFAENNINYFYYPLSIDKGLSQVSVNCIIQDKSGNLWLGTRKGLNVYKQNQITAFFHDEKNCNTLPSNYVNTLQEDSLGRIWVGTSMGLAIFDKGKNHFIRKSNHKTFSSLACKQGLFFGAYGKVIKYDYATDSLISYPIKDVKTGHFLKSKIVDIKQLSKQKILVATQIDGVFTMDIQDYDFKQLIEPCSLIIKAICLTPNQSIYVASANKGLEKYDLSGKLVEAYNTKNKLLDTNCILDIIEHKGILWLATDGEGLKVINLRTREFKEIRHEADNKFTPPSNSIQTIYIDRNDLLWAGSVRNGAFCIKKNYIRTFEESPANGSYGLSNATILTLYEEKDGLLWIGTDGGGINLFNPRTQKFKHFPSTYDEKIVSITSINEEELLVYVYPKGMFRFNKSTGGYSPFIIVNEEINKQECNEGCLPLGNRVGKDKIYIIGRRCLVYRPSKNSFTEILDINHKPFQKLGIELAHSNDEFSLLRYNNQVYYVSQKDDKVKKLFQIPSGYRISSLAYNYNHKILVGSDHGLGVYDMDTKIYKEIKTNLFSNVTSLVFDNLDRLWIGADNQLFSYEFNNEKFIQYNYSDGFLPNELLFNYFDTIKKKYIYLGGSAGLVQIATSMPVPEVDNPKIQPTDVQINGESVEEKEFKKLKIKSDYNSLSIMVEINTKDVLQRNLIRYSLIKGGNIQTFDTYDTRYKLPSSLSPGKYKLMASCITKTGEMTPAIQLMDFEVLPPWYLSNGFLLGFYMACLILVIGVLFYYRYIKAKQVRRNMHAYKQHVNEEKIEFLINVNHELRTPLTLIYAPLKQLMANKGKQHFSQQTLFDLLEKIYHQASNMYHIINTVLNINEMDSLQKEELREMNDINTVVSQIAEDLKNEAEQNGITFECVLDKSLSTIALDEWKCQIILANILLGIIHYYKKQSVIRIRTQKNSNGYVSITVQNADENLSLDELKHIFDKEMEQKISEETNALVLYHTKCMVESMGGRIDAYNSVSNGASIYFELPIVDTISLQNVMNEDYQKAGKSVNITKVKKKSQKELKKLKEYSVLVVDDNDEMNQFLHKMLIESFKEVYTANNGKDALDLCYAHKIELVISGVTMPVMNGFELCNQIKTSDLLHNTIVILLTARCSEQDEMLGYKMGADCYIKKPFDMDFLLTMAANLIARQERFTREVLGQETTIQEETKFNSEDTYFLETIQKIINENLSNEFLNLDLVTSKIGMSRATLYNRMIKLTGVGMNEYITQVRIEKAVELLLHSNMTVKEISEEVGFAYPRYFSTSFKNQKGMTPSEFKKRYQQQEE